MKSLASLVIVLGSALPLLADDTQVTLKYKFQEGDVLRAKVVHLVTVETKIKGSSQTAQSRSISTKNWKIEKVAENGEATFVHSVENIDMWQKVTDRPEQAYNSEKDKTPPAIYSEAAKSVGIPLARITVNAQGKVLEREQLGGTPSSESQILTILPEEPVSVGSTWNSLENLQVRTGGGKQKQIKTRQVFRLDSITGGVATISTESQVLTPIDDPTIKVELIQKLTKGKVRFDIAAGRILSQQLDLDETVIGFQGEASVMNYLGRMTEQLLTEPVKTAGKPTPASNDEAKTETK